MITAAFIILFVGYAFIIWQMRQSYEKQLRFVLADNEQLRDRLFAKHQMPPSGVNLTEAYVERKEQQRQQQHDPRKRQGPVEAFAATMAEKDLRQQHGPHRMAS